MDEGARYLGEVALVEYDSPISKSEKVFIILYLMRMLLVI